MERKIERALRENINFMWIATNNKPNFRTINKFRSEKLQGQIDEIFDQVVQVLMKEGCISLDACFLDGTKLNQPLINILLSGKNQLRNMMEKHA